MGTKTENGKTVTSGGRVLMVVGRADTLEKAREEAISGIADIDCPSLFWRHDIGHYAIDGK